MELQRTLVKSRPELWAAVSDPVALAQHLGEFGEIRITRTEPETAVAWEGEHASGTVALEASGWGTKVTLQAEPVRGQLPTTVEHEAVRGPEPAPRRGLFARLRRRPAAETPAPPSPGPSPGPPAPPTPDPSPPTPGPSPGPPGPPGPGPQIAVEPVLERVLESLGGDSRRPFTR